MTLLDDLNPRQREAVLATEGSVLVLAGAGTGKTRVITHRVAHLVTQGVPGSSILAVTFTNKAADQMKERVTQLLTRSGRDPGEPWIGTFHSFCAWLLRREAPRLGLPRGFVIYDEEDQIAAVKLAQLGHEDAGDQARGLLARISLSKNHAKSADLLEPETSKTSNEMERLTSKVFPVYEKILRDAHALDFDDLLLRAVEVLQRFSEALATWRGRFRYILVDEYQDTNRIQYELLHLLAGQSRNLCVVGDEDQSIYSWRGADVGNILRFEQDFPGTKVIRLEQNYRSSQTILDAAAAVVACNIRRLGKSLTGSRGPGTNLQYFEARDARGEADFVALRLLQLQRSDIKASLAVLYRTNFQSRAFEESLRRVGLRYRVLGGFSFYQRAEIKDALAYVRLAVNPDDDVALLRVLNTPPRGIGRTTVDTLREVANREGISLWSATGRVIESPSSGRTTAPLKGFRALVEGLRSEIELLSPVAFLRLALDRSGYLEMLGQRDNSEDAARAENLIELVNAIAEGSERGETLANFLDRAALVNDADSYDERTPIWLITLHSAKGLEFDHVFLVGLEEGVFPHSRSSRRDGDVEEERRLCYVGMTRARETLTLTRAVYRRVYGNERLQASDPSRFLREIPGELVDTAEGSLADLGAARRYEPDPEYSYSPAEFARRIRQPSTPSRRERSPRETILPVRPRKNDSNPLIGVRVRHPTYGVGTVIGVEGEGDDRKLTVSFSDRGTKKLVERYAQLEWA